MGNNLHIIIVVVIALSSLIIKIVTALREQADKRERQRRLQQAELDALRTGPRPGMPAETPVVSPPMQAQQSARATLEEMAAKRRAQIEELRRRRAAAGGAITVPPPQRAPVERTASTPVERTTRPTPTPMPSTSGETARRVRAQAERQQQSNENHERGARVEAANRQREESEKEQRARDVKRRNAQRELANNSAEAKTRAAGADIERRAAAVRGTTEPEASTIRVLRPAGPVGLGDLTLNRREMRRAILLQEMLGPPLSLRQ